MMGRLDNSMGLMLGQQQMFNPGDMLSDMMNKMNGQSSTPNNGDMGGPGNSHF